MFTDVVILAGGFGERLWPASSSENPKQFMTVSDNVSFLQLAVIRALSLKPEGKILIVTRRDIYKTVSLHCKNLLPDMSEDDKKKIKDDLYILPETEPKHTTAPIILACNFLNLTDYTDDNREHSVLVLTSDHIIKPIENFILDCKKACAAAANGKFVCFAIPPLEPATGYGYIKIGKAEGDSVFAIEKFVEKPDLKTATEYVKSGKYRWNSGMFGFTCKTLLKEIKEHQNDAYAAFENLLSGNKPKIGVVNGIKYVSSWPEMDAAYSKVPAVAIDKSVAEKTKNACAVSSSFNWDDIGSWDAFEKLFDKNPGETIEIESKDNFVYSDIPVALCGVEDLVVVIKNGKALIVKKGKSSLVRDAVKQMKNSNV
ncbi:mannose-1-phosphate guanylyltransferase [Treponema parvum]|uniref:Mannose-1-phosphate guanylyltransferase n=1 Tax=Treponema parvum TaxID=138851 RepID=A0A975IEH3_9SPIR|nr:sugar phosphate nucleotidyltransferase [Treponema parvum]QTQ13951.1 mannose-1-phosphate guanylyltransferase [Treponema parvum]